MPRNPRHAPGGYIYHITNRRPAGLPLFEGAADYDDFERVLAEGRERVGMRICAYSLVRTHWELVVWPRRDGHLSDFMRWVGVTHSQRFHSRHHTLGTGHVYQSRFKSFPIEAGAPFLRICRYVERNPLRARLVKKAENWRWSSLACRADAVRAAELLDAWPVSQGRPPADWPERIRTPETDEELAAVRLCIARGRPYGTAAWVAKTVAKLGLESSVRPRGRPRKVPQGR
jgi:putative transposase